MGRPPKDPSERKTQVVQVRATEEERAALEAAAAASEQTVSAWALGVLLRAAKRKLAKS